jgi:hypothetical protein
MSALVILCLAMLSSACSMQPIVHTVPVTKTVRQWVPIPADRVSSIDVPQPPPWMLWSDSLDLNVELYGVIEVCQMDRAAIRQLNEQYLQQ